METILTLFNPVTAIVIVIIFSIVAGIYFYMSKTPLEILIANSNERFKYHMSGILSMSFIYFVCASILIAFMPIDVSSTKEESKTLVTANTMTSLYKVIYENFTLSHFFFLIFVMTFTITVVVYVVINLVKKYTERNHYYQIKINKNNYRIIKGLPDNHLLLKKVTSNLPEENQIVSFDSINLMDITRVKK